MAYKTPNHIQEQKELKRQLILEKAAQLFVNKGYYNTSVKDIVVDANISVGSFYFYFASKEELLETLYDEMNNVFLLVLEDASKNINNNIVYALCSTIVNTLKLFYQNQEMAKILLDTTISTGPYFELKRANNIKRFNKIIEEILQELYDKKVVKFQNIEVAASSMMGGILYFITNIFSTEFNKTKLPEYVYALVNYNLTALGVEIDNTQLKQLITSVINKEFI